MALRRSKKKKSGPGMNPVLAGAIAFGLTVVVVAVVFLKVNPFHHPYELHATFKSANNLATNSPVRIAGVEVGKVTEVKPIKGSTGAAEVTMEIEKTGLPIHKDATLKIRPRIFLEGNLFVDVNPGTPQSPALKDGGMIPVNQTDTPVQFGEVLTALQSDTRKDLQTFLREYATNGLGNGGKRGQKTGAQYYNEGLEAAPDAFRNSAIANDATLGEQPGDLQRVIKSQQKVAAALSSNPESLKGLVTNLNETAAALSADESALAATVPALRDVVVKGKPALEAVDAALPSLRAFDADALPGVKSSPETLRESRPFIEQLRGLVSQAELRGLTADLRPTIPALAKLNQDTIPLLGENRALSACQNNVILPFAKTPIPDPDFPANSNQPFYKQSSRAFVGLAGESRIFDANSPLFHVQFSTGPTTVVYSDRGENFYAQAPTAPSGIRPVRPKSRPKFRPDVPCETQEPPNLNAPGGRPDRSVTPGPASLIPGIVCDIVGGLLVPCPGTQNAKTYDKGKVELNQVLSFFKAKKAGKAAVDPLTMTRGHYLQALSKIGQKTDARGNVIPKAVSDATKAVSGK
jgi:ABC-type transporter Mla subunit MlaD